MADDCTVPCELLKDTLKETNALTVALNILQATSLPRLERVEEGYANNITFQREARSFFTDHHAREEERKKFQELRDKEIKEALNKHYNGAQLANLEISNKLSKRNTWAAVASVCVGIASLVVVIGIFYLTNWVLHHG